MDYHVSIGNANLSYTVFMKCLFSDHMPGGIDRLNGMKGIEAVPVIANALFEIDRKRSKRWSDTMGDKFFEWYYKDIKLRGSVMGAILFLSLIMGECAMNPDATIRVE